MKSYKSGEIVEAIFPFEDSSESKIRPALVIGDLGDSLFLLKITSKHKNRAWDIELPKDSFNGLSVDSVIQVDKGIKLKKSKLSEMIPRGVINQIQLAIVKERIKEYMQTQR